MLTGNYSDADVVALFDAEADAYISKPCISEVLLARMRTLLRRSVALSAGGTAKHSSFTLTWGNLCLDMDSGRVMFGEQVLSLTATE
jgi:DNA-binding response OmpR family regulator